MTRTTKPDLYACQVADSNSDLRHLFRNPLAARQMGVSSILPIRYLKSSPYNNLQAWQSPTEGDAPVNVRRADADRSASQIETPRGGTFAGKCHVSSRILDVGQAHLRPATGATPSPVAGRGGLTASLLPTTQPADRTDPVAALPTASSSDSAVHGGHTEKEIA